MKTRTNDMPDRTSRSDACKRPRRGRVAGSRLVRTETGATMIEILVSAFILAMLVVPMFNALVAGRMLAAHRGEKRMALGLAERKLEQLMAAGYGSLGNDDDVASVSMGVGAHPDDPSIVVSTRGDQDATNDVLGTLTWNVTPIAWASPDDSVRAKILEVELRWPADAPRDSLSVTTLIGA